MATKGLVLLSDIFEMLKECAPGFDLAEGPSPLQGQVERENLPDAAEGRTREEARPRVGAKGKVKDLVTFFGIEECAKGIIEILR